MTDIHRTIDAVWKLESARIIAGLMRIVRDVGLAEELAQDALVAALEQWPAQGVPDNPGAWLTAIAKRRAVDHIRRARLHERKAQAYAREQDQPPEPERDDVLRLMFISCHPVLPTEHRVALTLRVVGGLTTREIARAFLVTEPVVARRIAAAKRVLAEAGVPFALPGADELAGRLSSVLEVIYLIFNEGYSATSGDDLIRPALCLEALRLGRMLAELAPDQAEVHGLVALMEIQASRSAARTGPDGEPIQLHEQNRGRWDQLLIRRGFTALLRARELGGTPGPYVLQAAIAVCHAQARTAEETDWVQIAALYDALARLMPTPIVRLNRAVAVGLARGPQAGLDLVDALRDDPALRDYHLLPGVRGDLLLRLGREPEARAEFERAAALAGNAAESAFLRRRADRIAVPGPETVTLGDSVRAFLARDDLGAETLRSYGQSLGRLCLALGDRVALADLTADQVTRACAAQWTDTSAASWNRHLSAIRSFTAWAATRDLTTGGLAAGDLATGDLVAGGLAAGDLAAGDLAVGGLAAGLARRAVARTRVEPIGGPELERLWARTGLPLRERTLWRLLHESAAGVRVVLSLNVEELDLDDRRARAGAAWVSWRAASARLLGELVAGRTRGPVFLADRRPGPARTPAERDRCPDTGRGRLSYERAEYLFKRATIDLDPAGRGYTLHRLKPR
ncbi:sigma-70 family RNA polymerase sigma factor [Actinoplanes sp. NPDC049668]|uniref:sigma-70 family RNA polymerase sigma factor n=1 Tax=unclassified Actinoplanes TaxID=2626549 RepID=UPI0033A9B615